MSRHTAIASATNIQCYYPFTTSHHTPTHIHTQARSMLTLLSTPSHLRPSTRTTHSNINIEVKAINYARLLARTRHCVVLSLGIHASAGTPYTATTQTHTCKNTAHLQTHTTTHDHPTRPPHIVRAQTCVHVHMCGVTRALVPQNDDSKHSYCMHAHVLSTRRRCQVACQHQLTTKSLLPCIIHSMAVEVERSQCRAAFTSW